MSITAFLCGAFAGTVLLVRVYHCITLENVGWEHGHGYKTTKDR